MYLIYVISLCSVTHLSLCAFIIQGGGHFPVSIEDVGIRFYLIVLNVMNNNITVLKAYDPDCCWQVEPGDDDCKSMELFGGFATNITAGQSKNISYVFPNLYPLDRIGACTFFLKEKNEKEVQHTVNFNTAEFETGDGRSVFRELLSPGVYVYKSCPGVDENMRNNCRPFDCRKKYNGYRNFYRQEKGKCERVTRCRTKLGKDQLPTTAFDFQNNRCKNLVSVTSQDEKMADSIMDKSHLAGDYKKYEDADPLVLKINCNHGTHVGGQCRCDEGWKSVSVSTESGGTMMDWCSMRTRMSRTLPSTGKTPDYIIKYALLIILFSVSSCLFIYTVLLWWRLLFSSVFSKLLYHIRRIRQSAHLSSFERNPLWNSENKTFNSEETENLLMKDLSSNEFDDNQEKRSDKLKTVQFVHSINEVEDSEDRDEEDELIELKDSTSFVIDPNCHPAAAFDLVNNQEGAVLSFSNE